MLYVIKSGTTGAQDGTIEVVGDGAGVEILLLNTAYPFHLRCPAGYKNSETVTVAAPTNCQVSKDDIAWAASVDYAAGEVKDTNTICYVRQTLGKTSTTAYITLAPHAAVVDMAVITAVYKKQYLIDTSATGANVATAQADFLWPVLIDSAEWPDAAERGHFFSDAYNPGGKRVRFYASDGITLLDYAVEYYDTATQTALYWVRVQTITGNSDANSIWLHYDVDIGTDEDSGAGAADASYTSIQHLGDNYWSTSPEARDMTINSHDAVNTGSTDAAGVLRRGRNFNDDAFLTFQDVSAYPLGAKTISFSIKTASAAYDGIVDNCGTGATNYGCSVYMNAGKIYWLEARGAAGNLNWLANSNGVVNNNAWHRVAVTWDGTTGAGKVKIYIDGADDGVYGAEAAVDGTETHAPTYALIIGKLTYVPDNYKLTGALDEVRVSSVARSADWVKLEYWSIHRNADCTSWGAEQAA